MANLLFRDSMEQKNNRNAYEKDVEFLGSIFKSM